MSEAIVAELSKRQLSSVADLRNPKLKEALAYWRSKCRDGTLPSRNMIDPIEMKSFIDRIMLVEVEHSPRRYLYRLVGTLVTRTTGRDATGQYWDEIYSPEHYDLLKASLDAVIESGGPCRSTGTTDYVGKDFVSVEVVDLPLSSDGATIDMILRVVDFSV